MIIDIPPSKLAALTNRWNAYQAALANGSPSLIATTLSVLMLTLNQCSVLLGRPSTSPPYTEPVPAVVEVDGVLKLEYPS